MTDSWVKYLTGGAGGAVGFVGGVVGPSLAFCCVKGFGFHDYGANLTPHEKKLNGLVKDEV
eukprot:CAMPEP_0201281182 /NCGR_PEP_ID=MMETSP1317-20130820/1852_1 /ASSEMBLY_ACC=CAM_ASM_000770 /TAXON_ID=187299 /ORGANISM="Undescribed Undescribed, Strain Undescribed" /LENGTH=60 /DNA_ID=CAMNT_0047590425 /DNA_START=487 /DNA_END=669 /DNA_ORIENTATION=-